MDCEQRVRSAPFATTDEAGAFCGGKSKGYSVISRGALLKSNRNANGSERENVLLHVMDSLANHGCLIVDLSDEDKSTNDATIMSKMWKTTSDFFHMVVEANGIDCVPWIQISQLLPFAPYFSNDQCLVAANSMTAHILDDAILTASNEINLKSANGDLPVEQELWNGGILWEPPRVLSTVDHGRRDDLDCDALETLLWLALEEFCRGTGFVLPNEVRCLMPPEMDYLDFTTSKCILSMYYPKRRRQRRLSYLAPAIIENVVLPMKGRRQIWLNAPSIAARLLDTLEWYDYLNNKIGLEMGEFE